MKELSNIAVFTMRTIGRTDFKMISVAGTQGDDGVFMRIDCSSLGLRGKILDVFMPYKTNNTEYDYGDDVEYEFEDDE